MTAVGGGGGGAAAAAAAAAMVAAVAGIAAAGADPAATIATAVPVVPWLVHHCCSQKAEAAWAVSIAAADALAEWRSGNAPAANSATCYLCCWCCWVRCSTLLHRSGEPLCVQLCCQTPADADEHHAVGDTAECDPLLAAPHLPHAPAVEAASAAPPGGVHSHAAVDTLGAPGSLHSAPPSCRHPAPDRKTVAWPQYNKLAASLCAAGRCMACAHRRCRCRRFRRPPIHGAARLESEAAACVQPSGYRVTARAYEVQAVKCCTACGTCPCAMFLHVQEWCCQQTSACARGPQCVHTLKT